MYKPYERKICMVKSCENTTSNYRGSWFKFPTKDPNRLAHWLKNLGPMKPGNLKWREVCREHFHMECFSDTLRRRLHRFAVPFDHGTKNMENAESLALSNAENLDLSNAENLDLSNVKHAGDLSTLVNAVVKSIKREPDSSDLEDMESADAECGETGLASPDTADSSRPTSSQEEVQHGMSHQDPLRKNATNPQLTVLGNVSNPLPQHFQDSTVYVSVPARNENSSFFNPVRRNINSDDNNPDLIFFKRLLPDVSKLSPYYKNVFRVYVMNKLYYLLEHGH